MGRRKIEIQPITHERNRSVTFLKRKNGLFKKAYELGVLCSVDVAVIIFEERAGHHLKLYQYCSGDIHDIVQRHMRYDGEKDTRTPHDFANNANAKVAGDGDGDDEDDGDDDDEGPRGNKKRGDPKAKTEYSPGKLMLPHSDMGMNDLDYPLHRSTMTIPPPPMPLHHASQLSPSGGGSSLPISGERHNHSGRLLASGNQVTKKQRLAPNLGNKLVTDDMYNGSYLPSPNSAGGGYSSRHPGQPSQMQYSSSYLGVTSPPPSLISSSFDFPSSGTRGTQVSRNSYSQRSSFSHQPDVYQQLMRGNLPPGQHGHGPGMHAQQSPDLLSAFLENEDHRQPHAQNPQFAPLDWPTHNQSHQQQQSAPPHSAHDPPQPGEPNWLDLFNPSNNQSNHQLSMSLPPANRDTLSWEREREAAPYSAERGSGGGGNPPSASAGDSSKSPHGPPGSALPLSPRSRKRMRTNSTASGSPPGVAGDGGGLPDGGVKEE
ncbi:hypothetical protein CONPUDRAFT_169672 [Coniophora puteana RWD-64-598 SS2]|uniref:MADS-box domain-containing protein n=1 Tax=Coniophora puteana (strain RWD-64-598) TaxID=741705 RepID=A0A5M3M7V3_CONPW|nr:uncharacterized protein CONPUDRAFT_169672 [Coniophora puteana RWD-64-598 SS2]EIW75308.1 hypothetical protein CONPUDRAFT_169672 [Coniophora puteana RWD-64-598 SS2]